MKFTCEVVIERCDCYVDCLQNQRVHILEMESFEQTFGAKAQRKRPKVADVDMEVTGVMLF